MATTFPTTIDTFTNPSGSDEVGVEVGGRTHSEFHTDNNDAIEALEAKVGVDGSAVTTSHDYKLSGVTGSDKAVSRTGTETLTNKTLTLPQINDTSSDHQYVIAVNELAADRTVTLPLLTTADEFVFKDHAVTLTNKTINGNNNTLTVLAGTQLSGATPIANGGTGQTTATEGFDALAPTTTKGDLIVRDTNDNIRLAAGTNNHILTADSTVTGGLKWAAIGTIASGKIEVDTTETTVAGTTLENTLFDTTITAGTISTNNVVRGRVIFSNVGVAGGDTITFRVKLGGSTLLTLSTVASVSSLNGILEFDIVGDGATNVQKAFAQFTGYASSYSGAADELDGDLTVGISKFIMTDYGTGAVDTTSNQTLAVTVQYDDTTGGNTITSEFWIVESIR